MAAGDPGGVGQDQREGTAPRRQAGGRGGVWLVGGNPAASSVCSPQVYIIAHVPLGYLPFARSTTAIREQHNQRLVAICRKYSHVIAGHFYGHTHRDSVMVLLDEQGWKIAARLQQPQHFRVLFISHLTLLVFLLQANPSILCLCLRL